jgi:hypothetical protein
LSNVDVPVCIESRMTIQFYVSLGVIKVVFAVVVDLADWCEGNYHEYQGSVEKFNRENVEERSLLRFYRRVLPLILSEHLKDPGYYTVEGHDRNSGGRNYGCRVESGGSFLQAVQSFILSVVGVFFEAEAVRVGDPSFPPQLLAEALHNTVGLVGCHIIVSLLRC